MALVPFGKPKVAGYNDKRVNRMPKRDRTASVSPQGAKRQTVGSNPVSAPPVDGALRGHDTNYPRPSSREY